MATPDAEHASPSPEYSDDDMAAEQNSNDGSPPQKTSGGKPTSGAKDPLRPRRKKARRACFACQRAHLTCGEYQHCLERDGATFRLKRNDVNSATVLFSDLHRR